MLHEPLGNAGGAMVQLILPSELATAPKPVSVELIVSGKVAAAVPVPESRTLKVEMLVTIWTVAVSDATAVGEKKNPNEQLAPAAREPLQAARLLEWKSALPLKVEVIEMD